MVWPRNDGKMQMHQFEEIAAETSVDYLCTAKREQLQRFESTAQSEHDPHPQQRDRRREPR